MLDGETVGDMLKFCAALALSGSPALREDMFMLQREIQSHAVPDVLELPVEPEAVY